MSWVRTQCGELCCTGTGAGAAAAPPVRRREENSDAIEAWLDSTARVVP